MAGVIDNDGQQWEHCHECAAWVRIEELWFLVPNQVIEHRDDAQHGLDLCDTCAAIYELTGSVVREPSQGYIVHL